MNPIEGTEILLLIDGVWYNKDSKGNIVATDTERYSKRYSITDSLVVVKGEDDAFISGLNPNQITIVVDKEKVGRHDLLTLKNTKEWMALSQFLKLRKATTSFCGMAKYFNIPSK